MKSTWPHEEDDMADASTNPFSGFDYDKMGAAIAKSAPTLDYEKLGAAVAKAVPPIDYEKVGAAVAKAVPTAKEVATEVSSALTAQREKEKKEQKFYETQAAQIAMICVGTALTIKVIDMAEAKLAN